jgi:hypothetical protein
VRPPQLHDPVAKPNHFNQKLNPPGILLVSV